MSKKGLRYVAFGKLQNDGTYSQGKHLSPAASLSGSANISDVKDYGDDRVVETDKSVTGGTLSVELNNDEDDIYTMLLGHRPSASEAGDVVYKDSDTPPIVGVGAIGKSGSNWVAKWYPMVQFHEPNDDNATRQEATNFGHITLEGDILVGDDGIWKEHKRLTTLAAAKTWLNGKAGIS